MAVTEEFFNGGTIGPHTINFQYLAESDVKVEVDGVLQTQDTDYTLDTTVITFTNATPAGTNNVRIFRDTDIDDLRNEFFAGSAIRAQDLNDDFNQTLFALQEFEDQYVTKTDGEFDTNVDMNGNRITNMGDPVNAQDAVTKQYLEDNYFDDDTETLLSNEAWVPNDTTIATTSSIENRVTAKIDDAITNDIAVSDGLTVTDDGDGTITLGIGAGAVDLDRIKAADIIVSGEANPNNDTTIATTAKIDDMIDAAITGDIAVADGLTLADDGDGTITLGIGAGQVDLDRLKADDIVTLAEEEANAGTDDDSIFTTSAAANRFDTLVQTSTPTGTYRTGKTWLQNDDNQTLKIWSGSAWLDVASGGSFRTQDKVIYVDATGGDDTKTGHRISGPKLTIRGAIADINADIALSTEASDGFNGGAGYTANTYNAVPLTHFSGTGIGTGVTADIVVDANNTVTEVTINNAATLENYSIGDVLTADDADLGGGGGSGLRIPIIGGGDGMTVIVAAGVYQEIAPIQIKRRNVSIVGMALRSTLVHPTVATQGDQSVGNHALFELNSGSFIQNLTLTGMKANNSGTNTLDADLPDRQGWNFAFFNGCFIEKSPYIQNCTNFSDSEIDNNDLRAHRPRGGTAGDTSSLPTGGGLLVDGSVPATTSPIRSMVADSYTHVGLNGPGILVVKNGYTQITSSYAFFNKYHIKCLSGGQANLAASTSDFGERSLIADGKSLAAIFTSNVDTAAAASDLTFNINEPTAGVGWFGSTERPAENMLVEVTNSDATTSIYPILSAAANVDSEGGAGWTVTISRPDPNNRSTNLGLEKALDDDAAVSFFLRSQIASSGHTMEYVGSGTNYNALPENGGVPIESRQITELNNGKIWTAITDHNGKFRIGGNQTDDAFFEVDQQLGLVTIPEGSIAFNLVSDTTPQLGGDLDTNDFKITSSGDNNVHIGPHGTGKIRVDAAIITAADNSIILDPHGNGKVEVTKTIAKKEDGATDSNLVLEPKGAGTVDVSTSRITSVTDPTSAQDAATKNYVDTTTTANPLYVAVAGDTMSGDLAMGNNKITGLGTPTAATDAATKAYVDGQSTVVVNDTTPQLGGDLDVNGNEITSANNGNVVINPNGTGSVGIGVTPETWASTWEVLQVGSSSLVGQSEQDGQTTNWSNNAYFDLADNRWEYISADQASQITQTDGKILLKTAAAGSADGAITWSESMRIDGSGNVGIGTTTPSTRFHSVGTTNGAQATFGSASSGLKISTFQKTNDDAGVILDAQHSSNGTLTFATKGSERMRIDGSGRILLGTTAVPTNSSSLLVVQGLAGNTTEQGILRLQRSSNNGTNNSIGIIEFGGTDGVAAEIRGIGDAAWGASDYPGRLEFRTTADGSATTTERLRINASGQISMGTAGTLGTAGSTVDVTVRMTPATSAYGIYSSNFSSGTTSTPGGYGVYGHMGGYPPSGQAHYGLYGKVDTYSLRASGGILGYSINNNTFGIIGYWSTAAYYGFYSNGSVYAAGGFSSSDARLKDIVSDGLGTGILDKVCKLQAKKFTWKENTQQRRGCENVLIGLLAQDVQIDFPEVVDSVKQTKITGVNPETLNEQLGDNLAVDYGKLVPVLVEALKEAKERIETLETKVAALEAG